MDSVRSYMNWSGGKDSSLCLYKVLKEGMFRVEYLLTSVNSAHDRVSMHGVRSELLRQQADAIGIPLKVIELPEQPGMEEYEREMEKKVGGMVAEGIHHSIFGDIYLEDLRAYREDKLRPMGIDAVFPLWKIPTGELMNEFLELGFKAIIVCVNGAFLDESFCGRIIDRSFIDELPDNVDICGENGEFHSFVFDGPIFRSPIAFQRGEIVYREYVAPKNDDGVEAKNYGFYFCDLLPVL